MKIIRKKLFALSVASLIPLAMIAGSGDVNGDGKVNVADIVAMINYLNEDIPDKFDEAAADLNGDGSIDEADVNLLAGRILEAGGDNITVISATSISDVNAQMKNLVDDITANGVGEGKEYTIEISGDEIQKSETDITLEIPKVEGSNINLVFDEAFTEGTTLNINASDTSSDPTKAVNTLAIILPSDSKGLKLNVDMPETTVTLKAPGKNVVYEDVVARTALTTLVVDDSVTINNMEVQGGTVQVNEGGLLDAYVFAAEHNEDRVYITEDGGVEPIKVSAGLDENGNPIEMWQIASDDGRPYYAKSLKIIKGKADYAITWFSNASHETIPLKTIVIGDGAVLRTNWVAMENIEGEGTAEIKYRLTSPTSYTDDTKWGGDKFYEFNADMSGVTNIRNIIFSQPEIAPDTFSVLPALKDSIAKGYIQHEPRLNLDVDGEIDGCTFMYNHVHFCPEKSCPTVKNTKFVHVKSDIFGNENKVEIRMPYNPNTTSNSITFDGCEFSENTKFFGYFFDIPDFDDDEIRYTGYVNFKNCKLGGLAFTGENTDFVDQFWALTGTNFIISFDDVPKYKVVWDGDFSVKPIEGSDNE